MVNPRAKASVFPESSLTLTEDLENNAPDKLIVHCVSRGKTVPHPSPFVLKLETYLRMADIPYEVDNKKPYGPNGKMPWITFNDQVLTDSQLIIEFLNKKYEKNLWKNLNTVQKAVGRSVRVSLEEHFYWAIIHWRFVKGIDTLGEILVVPAFKLKIAALILPRKFKKILNAQGIGRQSYETMVTMACEDLRDVSTILGRKKFLLGSEPTEVDAAIFGVLAQVLWGSPGSPYEELIYDELMNLKHYCLRMKDLYWSDWDELLAKDPE